MHHLDAKQTGTCVTVLTAEDMCGKKCERPCTVVNLLGIKESFWACHAQGYMQKCTLTCASPLAL